MRQTVTFRLFSLLSLLLLGAGCGGDPTGGMSEQERADYFQDLLIRGVAHSEIDEWPQAIEQFTKALPVANGDPVVAFGLAVAQFKSGDAVAAREWLSKVDDSAPAELLGRVEYLKAKLALEEGDVEGEAAAYEKATEIDPSEPAYPYALSQVVPRLGGADAQRRVGELVEQAAQLWPENGRLAAELAQWTLGRDDVAMRQRGVDLVVGLAKGQPDVEALVERGLEEFAANPARTPVSLRRALNLLRPGKRFQTDSALLETRLAVLPLGEPVASGLRQLSEPAAARVTFERANLLPQEARVAAGNILQIELSNDATDAAAAGAREANLMLLTEEAVWFLGAGDDSIERVTQIEGGAGQILVGEFDGDGWMEILVLSSSGVELWGRSDGTDWSERSLEPDLAAAGGLREAVLVDFEHDGDLDLLAIDAAGKLLLVTHRGEAGLGSPEPAPLEIEGPVDLIATLDLDGDVDQDLVLGSASSVQVMTNWRQGEFRVGPTLAGSGELRQLAGVDIDSDGLFDLVGLANGELTIFANRGEGGLVADQGAADGFARLLAGRSIDAISAADMDLDGAVELLVVHSDEAGNSALSLLEAAGGQTESGRIDLGAIAAGGVAAIDLDGDHDPDPLVWGESGIVTATASGAETQGWLGVSLRGLMGKVPLDGRGARLDVSFGLDKKSFEITRPEIIVGRGGRKVSLLKVTWPNGISEFMFEPAADGMNLVEQELRIEGSCPFLYASDGEEKRFITDILGLAPLGMLAAPDAYVPPDPEEYLRLPDWVHAEDSVEISITEELREVAYLDQLELVAVDAPTDVEVYNGERWIEGVIEGLDLRLLSRLRQPSTVRDSRGEEVLDIVAELDQVYLENHDGDRLYQGAVPPHTMEIGIPAEIAASGRAALVMTGWLHWGNTSTNVARAQDPAGASIFPYLEVATGDGEWKPVDLQVGLPAGKTKPVVVDLGGVLNEDDPRVRITTDFEVYWDRIAVAELLGNDATDHRVNRVAPSTANLSYGGFSAWYRPSDNGPYLFDYSDRQPVPWRENASGRRPLAWQEHEGYYTEFGKVTDLVAAIDDRLVVFGAGEELELSFPVADLPELPQGWSRTLFLHSEGWEKDGDPNIACGQTVGPMPWRTMERYPCSGLGVSAGELSIEQRRQSRQVRWVGRHRLERRVAAWGAEAATSSGG